MTADALAATAALLLAGAALLAWLLMVAGHAWIYRGRTAR